MLAKVLRRLDQMYIAISLMEVTSLVKLTPFFYSECKDALCAIKLPSGKKLQQMQRLRLVHGPFNPLGLLRALDVQKLSRTSNVYCALGFLTH